jgi:hypothetical protein
MIAAFVALAIWFRRRRNDGECLAAATIDSRQAVSRLLRFAAFALAGALTGLAIELALKHDPVAAARVLRYYWFRQVDVALPMAIAIVGSGWVVAMIRIGRPWARMAALAPVLFSAWFLGQITYHRFQSNLPPALSQVENAPAWQEACGWIAENAPADARFLIPRWGHSFKWYASRADVASNKDVPQDAAGVVAWRARVGELFPTIDALDDRGRQIMLDSPELLGAPRVVELAKKYGASHVIARSSPRLDLPILFETEPNPDADVSGYIVYETGVAPTAIP